MSKPISPPDTPLRSSPTNPFLALISSNSSSSSSVQTSPSFTSAEASTPDCNKKCKFMFLHSRISVTMASTEFLFLVLASDYIWIPPPPDPKYWEHVHQAQDIRQRMAQMEKYLVRLQQSPVSSQRYNDTRRISSEITACERKLMRFVDHYMLDYSHVVSAQIKKSDMLQPAVLGTLSPPTSPIIDQPHGIGNTASHSKQLLPGGAIVPPETAAAPPQIDRLNSRAFMDSYKQQAKYDSQAQKAIDQVSRNNNYLPKPKGKLAWANLFGSKNVRPNETIRNVKSAADIISKVHDSAGNSGNRLTKQSSFGKLRVSPIITGAKN